MKSNNGREHFWKHPLEEGSLQIGEGEGRESRLPGDWG